MKNAGTSFTVRFLKNGDYISLVSAIITESGKGTGLFQVVDPELGTVAPKWTDNPAEQPIIQIGVRSANGFPTEITGCVFAYDGTTLHFSYEGDKWVTGDDDRFMSRINNGKYELRIVKDLASKEVVSNKQITYSVTYVSNAMSDTILGSTSVLIQQAGATSHILQIVVDGTIELSEAETSTVLRAVAQYGTKSISIGSDSYTIEWYQDDKIIAGQNKAQLTVTRDMVEGGSVFVAKLKKAGSVVAQDAQRVNDVADEYQVCYIPVAGNSGVVTMTSTALFDLSVTCNGKEVTGAVTYAWQLYNALGVQKGSGSTGRVAVTADDCLCEPEGMASYYNDVDARASASFS